MKKQVVLSLVLAYSPLAMSSELDVEPGHVTTPAVGTNMEVPKDVAQALPPTIVIRVDRKTGETAVLKVGQKMPADRKLASKLEKAPFKALTVDGQLTGQIAAADESDAVSSTSSWGFGFQRPAFGWAGTRPGYGWGARPGYGWGRPGYGWGGRPGFGYRPPYVGRPVYGVPAYGYRPYAPALAYGGYNFAYQPYYGYNTAAYSYTYCQPPVQAYAAVDCCGAAAVPYANPYASNYYVNAGYWRW